MLWEDKTEVEALCQLVNECQGLPVTTRNWGGAWTWSFSEPSVKTNPTNNLISHFQPPELWGNTFPLFWATQFVVVYYGRPRKLTHLRKNLVYYILEQGCLVKSAWWSNFFIIGTSIISMERKWQELVFTERISEMIYRISILQTFGNLQKILSLIFQ